MLQQRFFFFERVEELHRTFNERSEVILGHLMAHEIAHLLLGTNVHSVSGISVVRIGIGVNWPAPTEVGCYSMGRNQNHETKSILRSVTRKNGAVTMPVSGPVWGK